MSGRRAAALVCALALAALGARAARADGDPASDVLIVQTVFLPFQAQLPRALQANLQHATVEATKTGYPIRVALIEQPLDLGAVPSLFGKPQEYAQFLWQELSFVYKGSVLVVMPKGFGFYNGRPPSSSDEKVLQSVPIGSGLDGMAASALNAVVGLAAASGHKLSVKAVPVAVAGKSKSSSGSSSTNDRLIIGGAAAGGVLLAAAVVVVRRRRA
jgi:uncharacterized protein (TIGR03382 family)